MGYAEVGEGQIGEDGQSGYFKTRTDTAAFQPNMDKNYKDNRISMISHPDSYKEELADEVSDLGHPARPSVRPTLAEPRSSSFGDESHGSAA